MSIFDQSQNESGDQLPSAFGSAAICEVQEKLPELDPRDSRWESEHIKSVFRKMHIDLAAREQRLTEEIIDNVSQLRVMIKPKSFEKINKLLKKLRSTREEATRLNSYRMWREITPLHLRQRKDDFARAILDEHRACGDGCNHESESCQCTICYEKFDSVYTKLQCGHIFHYECVLKWLVRTNSCPMCRRNDLKSPDGRNGQAQSNPTWTEVYGWCDELLAIAPWDLIDNAVVDEDERDEDSDDDESDDSSDSESDDEYSGSNDDDSDEDSDGDHSDQSSDPESADGDSDSENNESAGNDSEDHINVHDGADSRAADASRSAETRDAFRGDSERGLRAQAPEVHDPNDCSHIQLPRQVQEWLLDRQRRRRRLEYVPSLFPTDNQHEEKEEKTACSRPSYSSLQHGRDQHTNAEREVCVNERDTTEREIAQWQGRRGRSSSDAAQAYPRHIHHHDHSLANAELADRRHGSHRESSPATYPDYCGSRNISRQKDQWQRRHDQPPVYHRGRSPTYRDGRSLIYRGDRSPFYHRERSPTYRRERSHTYRERSHTYRDGRYLTDAAITQQSWSSRHERFAVISPTYGGRRFSSSHSSETSSTPRHSRSLRDMSRCPPLIVDRTPLSRQGLTRRREMSPPRDPRVYWSIHPCDPIDDIAFP